LLAKMLWLEEAEAATARESQHLLLGAHSFVAYRLCGAVGCDRTTASTTGLLAPSTNR
jgi:xylulokinase